MIKKEVEDNTERARERSPIDMEDSDYEMNNLKEDRNNERDRDRIRRGDRSRISPKTGSGGYRDKDRPRNSKKAASDRRIYVSNVAYEYKWQALKDLFRKEVGEVTYVELFVDENEKPRGCGIVEFESPESVKIAVEKMHRYDLNGRKLVVKEDFGVERDKFGHPVKGGTRTNINSLSRSREEPRGRWDEHSPLPQFPSLLQGAGNSTQLSKWGNTYGLSPEFLESLWITTPLVTRVFVANLDYIVDEKKLREVFKLAGKVVSAEINIDKDGKSRGFGVVEFEHPVEAVQAISMLNNQMLYGRKISVRMDRVDPKSDIPGKLPEGLRGVGMGLGPGGAPLLDISRNLPSEQQLSMVGLGGAAAGGGGGGGLGGSLGPASALTNVVNPSILGVGSSSSLSAGLATVGTLGHSGNLLGTGSSLMGTSSSLMGGGGSDIGLGVGGHFGSSGIVGAGTGMGGHTSFSGSLSGTGSNSFLGSTGGGFGNSASSLMRGGSRDFDTLSAALAGGGNSFGSSLTGRDFRDGGSDQSFANGPSRGMGMSGTSGSRRSSDTIVLKNLPPSITWQMLRDKFNIIGDVKFVEMRGKDFGLVRFGSELEAERAVHMTDRTRLDGRVIEASLFPSTR